MAIDLSNNSGQGSRTPVFEAVSKPFNWGAFAFQGLWGVFNGSYITLITVPLYFIPFIGKILVFGFGIWFGRNGNTWAWRNRRWTTLTYFHKVQKRWAVFFVILLSIAFISFIIKEIIY